MPFWTIPIALVTGNTIIVKPSEKVPFTLGLFAELIKQAGIPDGYQIYSSFSNVIAASILSMEINKASNCIMHETLTQISR